ncbi:molybdate ABC transporter substrate-binding protein [Parahaliea mediterranea]|uniref:Molybdate ABC transporter substrate-binding protein n=1 Tax=Parahaliea mediterranea TaxID=651086 RepID=A0A939IN16_9GAMM|nr:molybdate ABC transporter substrate-binding protein [Parahaliea mediterranea]MBN7797582.1 molybdate ABC transporter substrate-binding protein [Parahaliea mediterranea]
MPRTASPRHRSFAHLVFSALLWLIPTTLLAQELRIAVAANFVEAMQRIAADFTAQTGHQVVLSPGSSGRIYAQITAGAPYDLFFSADQAKPAALEQAGLIVPGSRFTYAVGGLALWSARPGFLDHGPRPLERGDFNRLALANPRLAPYGQAATEVLERLGLTASTEAKWVRGENIAHAYQYVATGNADLGFIALSQLRGSGHSGKGSYWVVPRALYSPIRQDAVQLLRARAKPSAEAFLRHMRGDGAAAIMAGLGYQRP